MSLEATYDLSIQDLLRVLNEKLSLECTRIQENPTSRTSLESEVSTRQPILVPMCVAVRSNSSGLHRSIVLRPVHAMS